MRNGVKKQNGIKKVIKKEMEQLLSIIYYVQANLALYLCNTLHGVCFL